MTAEIGNFLLNAALIVCLVQSCRMNTRVRSYAILSFALIFSAFLSLMYAYIVSDFSLLNVYKNSHTLKPMLYKITGVWGNHEGSMLLLALILSAYNLAFALLSRLDETIRNKIINIQALILMGFLSFVIFTSNPFEVISPVPAGGLGLNPLLQDIGLAAHPPVLYMGYIGFSLAFSYAVAALMIGGADKKWAESLKRWTIFSWSFLTLGIGLGSWWAYRELGWGGFWFWDPVENSSLMPWISGTALLHCLLVMEKRGALTMWTILMSIITFSLCLIGIFLVRSGVLTSVHAFANDPARGMFILAFLCLVAGSSLTLFALKAGKLKSDKKLQITSKEGLITINNFLLVSICATILLGTTYPLFLQLFSDHTVSVGAPYFNSTVNYMVLPLLVIMAVSVSVKWKKDSFKRFSAKLNRLFGASLVLAYLFFTGENFSPLAYIATALSIWLILQTSWSFITKTELNKKRFNKQNSSFYAMTVSHMGIAIVIMGISLMTSFEQEKEVMVKDQGIVAIAGYDLRLDAMYLLAHDNYLARQGNFTLLDKSGNEITTLKPEVRFYPVEQSNTTESAIYTNLLSNIYLVMGDTDDEAGFAIRVYYKPFVNMIWFGCLIIASGGFMALVKKRKT